MANQILNQLKVGQDNNVIYCDFKLKLIISNVDSLMKLLKVDENDEKR